MSTSVVSTNQKIWTCLIAGFLGASSLSVFIDKHRPGWLPEALFSITAILYLTFSFSFIFVWSYREKKQLVDSQKVLGVWQGVIIYTASFVLLRFGMLKLLGMHMNSSLIFSDFPAGNLSGGSLMDYFFGRAPLFKLLIGGLQVLGAILLLYRRTRLLGIFILLPILFNIVLMDIFYNVGTGVTILSALLIIALFYFLIQDFRKVYAFFFEYKGRWAENPLRVTTKNLIRLSIVAIVFINLLPGYHKPANPDLWGKYNIADLVVNNQSVIIDKNQDSVLTTAYFDENNSFVLRYNNYKKIIVGNVKYDDATRNLAVIWRYPKQFNDTLKGHLSPVKNGKMTLTGTMGNDSLSMSLIKVDLPFNPN